MSRIEDVPPPEILNRLRTICRQLPQSYEEPAWIGVRWRIRTRTFAHVYTPDADRFPVYAPYRTAGQGPVVMTFRVSADDLLGLTADGFPFFRADWGHNVAAAILGDHTDWTELTELITDSYLEMAPKFLAARVVLPPPIS
ncbi:YjbR protein [Streptomyces brevispora]|uniref:YjbR protein n=1 Tax=Streptomyces brevispora TaxID=887462 RepID=A0A561V6E4_9ACTN|nr:MmcQ/YjbR family DNA-binding protein [Streptomyces brevispora]TWG07176.1 YjbR protein [Streptomyces brevispora]